jgi:hypothetical protein
LNSPAFFPLSQRKNLCPKWQGLRKKGSEKGKAEKTRKAE